MRRPSYRALEKKLIPDARIHRVANTHLFVPWLTMMLGYSLGSLFVAAIWFRVAPRVLDNLSVINSIPGVWAAFRQLEGQFLLAWLSWNAAGAVTAILMGAAGYWAVFMAAWLGLIALVAWVSGEYHLMTNPGVAILLNVGVLQFAILHARSRTEEIPQESSESLEGQPARKPGRIFIVLGIISCLGSFPFGLFAQLLLNSNYDDRRFSAERWQEVRHRDEDLGCNGRAYMVRDLTRYLLANRPDKQGVISALGEPDAGSEPRKICYNLGMCSGLSFDYDTFEIHFDQTGRVSEAYPIQH